MIPHTPVASGEEHESAVVRLEAAINDQRRLTAADHAAQGTPRERTAAVAVAAANERLAARRAWLRYVEQGY
jgi:hypothetical protein